MEPAKDSLTALDRLLYDGASLRIGLVVARPSHPLFLDDGPVRHHAVHFHSRALIIEKAQGQFLVDPLVVSFFARGDAFQRRSVHRRGENSLWIAFDPDLLCRARLEVLRTAHTVLVDRWAYLSHIALREMLTSAGDFDALSVEETALALLERVLTVKPRGKPASRGSRAHNPDERAVGVALAVRRLLATRYDERLCLPEIAAEVGCSAFHLTRLFRRATGTSIHRYRTGLRLREALGRLAEGADDLTRLALDLGFCSHSHLTTSFTNAYRISPTMVRGLCKRGEFTRLQVVAAGNCRRRAALRS